MPGAERILASQPISSFDYNFVCEEVLIAIKCILHIVSLQMMDAAEKINDAFESMHVQHNEELVVGFGNL